MGHQTTRQLQYHRMMPLQTPSHHEMITFAPRRTYLVHGPLRLLSIGVGFCAAAHMFGPWAMEVNAFDWCGYVGRVGRPRSVGSVASSVFFQLDGDTAVA